MRGLRLTLLLGALLLVPASAHAATITYSGGTAGTIVYSAAPGESLNTGIGYDDACTQVGGAWYDCVTFSGDAVTAAPSPCAAVGGVESCVLDPNHTGIHVVGGAGNDAVSVWEAGTGGFPASTPYAIAIDGGGGNDVLDGGSANETLHGGPGADQVSGRGGSDVLYGDDGNDVLRGDGFHNGNESSDGGSDQLYGGGGDDTLTGDAINSSAQVGADLLDGGSGVDTVYDDWYRFAPNDPADQDPAPTVTFDGVANDGRPGEGDNVVGVEKVNTGYLPDQTAPATVVGSAGPDTVNLLFAHGSVSAGGGDDVITGSDFADALDGGPGNDQISGGFGDDVITGGPGVDNIGGDRTAACFYGPIYGSCTIGSGNDTIYAQDGEADTVDCGPGTDVAYVDAIDHVAGCETVHASGGAPGPGGGSGGGNGPPPATQPLPAAPRVSLTVSKRLRLRTIARTRRLAVRCKIQAAGRCRVRITITAKDARKLHLKRKKHAKSFVLGTASKTFKKAGKATLQVKLARRTAAALRHAKRLKLTITATSTAAGHRARTVTIRRTVKR